jgi:hypothetical protein
MPNDMRVFCNSCKQITRHIIQNIFEQVKADGQIVQWLTIQCAGCDDVTFCSLRVSETGSDGQDESPVFYPTRLIRTEKQFDGLDARLDRIYGEMIDAFNNGSIILCASALRALVEGICAEQNITDGPKRNQATGEFEINKKTGAIVRGRTLDCKIEGLAERHILNERQARSLHEHRYLGNMALHELEIPNEDMLGIAITIVEHIMEDLYSIPAQVGNLMRMRTNNPR